MKRNWISLICLSIVFMALPAFAQDDNKPSFRFRASGQYVGKADVGDGEVSTTSERIDFNWRFLSVSYMQTQFHWGNVNDLSFGNGSDDPWEQLHRIRVGANYRGKVNDEWFYHTGLTLTSTFEKEMDGSYGTALRGGVGYKWSDEVSIMAGLAIMYNPLRMSVMPNMAVEYDGLNDSGVGWKGRIGFPSVEMGYHFDEVSGLRASIGPDGQTARLADDSTVVEEGYVKMSGWQSGLYYDWTPSKALSLSVGPEYSFNRSMTFYDRDGDEVDDEDIGTAWGGALRVRYSF